MLRHVLQERYPVLEAKGIRTFKRMVQISEHELSNVMDVSVAELEIAVRCCPKPALAFDMFMNSVNTPTSLRTTLSELDKGLYGGIPCSAITELVGASGIGKSQFCMLLAVLCAIEHPNGTILYFNSGHNFSAKRIREMADANLSPQEYMQPQKREAKLNLICSQIRIVLVKNLEELHQNLSNIATALDGSCKMIIIDSLATLAQESSLDMSLMKRQMLLMNIASTLKYLAAAYEAYIVLTNYASTKINEDGVSYSHPALGIAWSHSITIRIVLESTISHHRTMTILKSSMSPHISFPFDIHRSGLVASDQVSQVNESLSDLENDELWANFVLPAVDDYGTLIMSQSQNSLSDNEEKSNETTMFDIVPNSDSEEDWN
ncbi:hypothetical protein THRCLA_08489 [Thraustotheca clavata]|uniref:RecA family profile 1 domain-containing protein n=1 Tax=Thraustotheca clavata TaxID=74557 RepID=A0A1V9Z5G9_9STRA|nr:hypothetical protein THRCLA_08489 [Thraustotheca clavata]